MELWKTFEFSIESESYKCQTKRNKDSIFELYIDGKNNTFHYRDMNFINRDISQIVNRILLKAIEIIQIEQKTL